MDLISVIVPVYKAEKYLGECIDSILSQTYESFELILVDDGSPDNSGKICDEYAEKDKRIRVIHKENGGVSSARNLGLDNANGEYFTFLDADDYFDKNYLEFLYNRLSETNSDFCFGRFIGFTENTIIERKYSLPEECNMSSDNPIFIKFISNFFKGIANSSCAVLFKKSLLNSIRFNEGLKNYEDFLFTLRYLLNCKKFCSEKNAIYFCRRHAESCSRSYVKNLLSNDLTLYDELLKIDNPLLSKRHLSILFCRLCHGLFLNELKFKNVNSDYKSTISRIKKSVFYKYFKLKNIFRAFVKFLSKAKVSLFYLKIKLHLY